jgi:exopolysaccharide biosynthesis protein
LERENYGNIHMLKRKIIFGIIASFIGLAIIFFYGPFPQFRLLWINTAMYSSRHKFLATGLYTKNYIDKVINMRVTYENPDNELLVAKKTMAATLEEIIHDYYRGYMITIRDPERLMLVIADNEEGRLLEDLNAENQGEGGVNAGGYRDHEKRGLPWGTLITGGETVSSCDQNHYHVMGGFDGSNKLVVGRMTDREIAKRNFKWALEFGPALIINGKKMAMNSYTGGLAPRTAIGQTNEGHVLLLVIDGRQGSSFGATFQGVRDVLFDNGAINAICLDGGSSSSIVYGQYVINSPSEGKRGRLLPNAIIFR